MANKPSRLLFLALLVLVSCTEGRVKRYQQILDPMLGKAKKSEVNKVIGSPTKCEMLPAGIETCEYRTAKGRNNPVPDVHRRQQAMGPDLSPYEYFDVLHLQYDGFGVFKDWEPIDLPR